MERTKYWYLLNLYLLIYHKSLFLYFLTERADQSAGLKESGDISFLTGYSFHNSCFMGDYKELVIINVRATVHVDVQVILEEGVSSCYPTYKLGHSVRDCWIVGDDCVIYKNDRRLQKNLL